MYQQKDRGFNCINKYKLRKILKQGSLTHYLPTTTKEEKFTEYYRLNMWKTSFLNDGLFRSILPTFIHTADTFLVCII